MKGQIDCCANPHRRRHTGYSRYLLVSQRAADRPEDDGDTWKDLVSVFNREFECRLGSDKDEIQLRVNMLASKRLCQALWIELLFRLLRSQYTQQKSSRATEHGHAGTTRRCPAACDCGAKEAEQDQHVFRVGLCRGNRAGKRIRQNALD